MRKKLRANYFCSLTEKVNSLNPKHSKSFWNAVKESSSQEKNMTTPISIDEWVNHYKSLLQMNGEKFDKLAETETQFHNETPLDFPFTCKEVKTSISSLKLNKKEGIDLILNEFIKYGSSILLTTLVKLFNKILKEGIFPESWNLSLLSSIYKSGDPMEPNNYRGISVCSCLGKLFTRLLQKRLDVFLESNNLLSPNQAGFRKGQRTTDNVYILKSVINKYICKPNGKVFTCFVDFKKAFDSVWRQALLYKILKLGIGVNFL